MQTPDDDFQDACGKQPAKDHAIDRAAENYCGYDAVSDLGEAVAAATPFPTPAQPMIAREGDTEYLLNGLIAECHYMMRELALPSAALTREGDLRMRFISSAMDLARTGASVAKAIAKLRAIQVPELPKPAKTTAKKNLRT